MLGSKASFGANNEHINTCCIRTNLMKNGCDILQQMNRAMCKTRSRMYMTINLRFNSNGPVLEDYCYASKCYFTIVSCMPYHFRLHEEKKLYSRVFLLAEGRVAFSGPIPDAIEFFKRQVLR